MSPLTNAYVFEIPVFGVEARLVVSGDGLAWTDGGALWRGGIDVEELEYVVESMEREIRLLKAARYDRESEAISKKTALEAFFRREAQSARVGEKEKEK